MYSTKHLENILLAELTRKQYKQFMDDVADSTGLYFKQIRNVRNSDTFKKVFGNKQRIWIPLDIEVDSNVIGDNKETYNSLYRKHISVNQTLSNILNGVTDLFSLWETITRLAGKQEIDTMKIKSSDLLLYWLKGYVKVNGRIFKFGTLINRLLSMAKKVYANDEIALNDAIKELSRYLSNFQNRKNELDKLPKDLLDIANSLTDEDIYGTAIKKDRLYICISRYPADVAAMSTGQGWSSCQNLDHDETKTSVDYTDYNWHVKYDISLGTCVAYLIKESAIRRSMQKQNVPNKYDKKFEGKTHIPKTSLFPLLSSTARIAIKPFYNAEKNQIYLTIGTNARVYGDNTYGSIFRDTVRKYLEERQSDISGEFRIPRELYNEGIGDYNTLAVENGEIIDKYGANDMLEHENEYNQYTTEEAESILDEITHEINTDRDTAAIFNDNRIDGWDYVGNLKLIYHAIMTSCTVNDCKSIIVDNKEIDRYNEYNYSNFFEDAVASIYNNDTYFPDTTYNYPDVNRDTLIEWTEELRYKGNVFNTEDETSTITHTEFENCGKIFFFNPNTYIKECHFTNIGTIYIYDIGIDQMLNDCEVMNCKIVVLKDYGEIDADVIGKNWFEDVQFSIGKELYEKRFIKSLFKNCSFIDVNKNGIDKISEFEFEDCTINDTKLSGKYVLREDWQDFITNEDKLEITTDLLVKEQ